MARTYNVTIGLNETQQIVLDDFTATTLDTNTWVTAYPWWPYDHLGQRYEVNRADQVSLHDSYLDIYAKRQTTTSAYDASLRPAWPVGQYPDGFPFRSGVISTGFIENGSDNIQGARWAFQYGLLEIRAYFPVQPGPPWSPDTNGSKIWPAFWLLKDQSPAGGGSDKPEIDIIDMFGSTKFVQYSLEGGTTGRFDGSDWGDYSSHAEYGGAWHTWALDWTADTIKFLVDGVVHGQYTGPVVPDAPYFLMINTAVGHEGSDAGGRFGPPELPGTPDDHHLLVDWVKLTKYPSTKVYRRRTLQ